MKSPASVLFLGKKGDEFSDAASSFLRAKFQSVLSFYGEWGVPLPVQAAGWHGDYIVSYLSRWVVPEYLLRRAKVAAINFHPAPPEFPGIGCTNFALYHGADTYGSTCHHMEKTVDTGSIIAVRRFSMSESDDVASLLDRTYKAQFELFLEIAALMRIGHELPRSSEKWSRPPYTRREFNELNQLTSEMSQREIALRIRSCAFGPFTPKDHRLPERLSDSEKERHPQLIISPAQKRSADFLTNL